METCPKCGKKNSKLSKLNNPNAPELQMYCRSCGVYWYKTKETLDYEEADREQSEGYEAIRKMKVFQLGYSLYIDFDGMTSHWFGLAETYTETEIVLWQE